MLARLGESLGIKPQTSVSLVRVFADSKEPLEKRRYSGELMSIDSDLWRRIGEEDVHESLKQISGLKLPKDSELVNLRKNILTFWDFGDVASDNSKGSS